MEELMKIIKAMKDDNPIKHNAMMVIHFVKIEVKNQTPLGVALIGVCKGLRDNKNEVWAGRSFTDRLQVQTTVKAIQSQLEN